MKAGGSWQWPDKHGDFKYKLFHILEKIEPPKLSKHYLNYTITRVVPKLMLILSGQTCNGIYRNSDKARVFCSVLSFQQAHTDICTLSRSRVTAGFVKTVVCTLLVVLKYNSAPEILRRFPTKFTSGCWKIILVELGRINWSSGTKKVKNKSQ